MLSIARYVGVLVLGSAAVVAACSDPTPQPRALGGCTSINDASCAPFAGGGGAGGSTGGSDGSSETDSGFFEPTDAAAVCGMADQMLSVQTPACGACVAAGQDAGSASCCAADTACSQDPTGCLTILQCAIQCTAGGSCSAQGTCAALASGASVILYNTLASCMGMVCAGLCPPLSSIVGGD